MKCGECGGAELVQDTRDIIHTYKGEKTTIPQVTGNYCPSCGAEFFKGTEADRVMAAMGKFNKEVNATLVDASFIASTRKKLELDQREAAHLFGGGANAFSRYETGKAVPPVTLVHLFTILDAHPEMMQMVRANILARKQADK